MAATPFVTYTHLMISNPLLPKGNCDQLHLVGALDELPPSTCDTALGHSHPSLKAFYTWIKKAEDDQTNLPPAEQHKDIQTMVDRVFSCREHLKMFAGTLSGDRYTFYAEQIQEDFELLTIVNQYRAAIFAQRLS